MSFRLIDLAVAESTNSVVSQRAGELESFTFVRALSQTAGRGQRGNSWESEAGKNLTFSVLWRPQYFKASRQFAVSEAVALGVVDALADFGINASVKWPNDIYVGERKICGILIEHAVMGSGIMHSVCGVGVNVNQEVFVSDAPNPVSMAQIRNEVFDLDRVMSAMMTRISGRLRKVDMLDAEAADAGAEVFMERQHAEFLHRMWRNDGKAYRFHDVARAETYSGVISDVGRDGMLNVAPVGGGALRRYAFKEVAFV